MAGGKEAVVTLKINGLDYALKTAEDTKVAVEALKTTAEKPIISGAAKAMDQAAKSAFTLEQQIEAVNKLGFNKAVAQGFIQTRGEIEAVNAALQAQKIATTAGSAEFEKNAKVAAESAKVVEAYYKADEKAATDAAKAKEKAAKEAAAAEKAATKEVETARLDSLKETLKQQGGFAKAVADGTIKTVGDIRTAYEFLKKNAPFGSEDLKQAEQFSKTYDKVYREIGQDTEDFFKEFKAGFTVINQQTGEAVVSLDAIGEEFDKITKAEERALKQAKELELTFDDMSIESLEKEIGNFSPTKLNREIDGLKDKLNNLDEGVDFQEFEDLKAKIAIAEQELKDKLLPAFAKLSLQEVKVEIENSSRKRLEKQVEDLQNEFNKLKPSDKGYTELQDKLKIVKNRLIDIDEVSAGIKGIDLTQAYVDIGTKGVEGLANASRAVGALGGNLAEAEELAAQFDKGLQVIAVAQSAVDSVKAYGEAMKGVNGSFLSAATGAKVFKFALAATGIGAVALIVGLLISQFGGLKKVLGVVSDALSSTFDGVSAVFGVIQKTVGDLLKNTDKIKEGFLTLGELIFNALTIPLQTVTRTAIALYDVITGKKGIKQAFADQLKDFAEPFVKTFNAVTDLAGDAGDAFGEAFGKGFDARQGLRENERKKKLLESLNAERAIRQGGLEKLLGDETLSFEKQKALIQQIGALKKIQVSEELALNQERVNLLKQLGANASEEQKTELIELTKAVKEQQQQLKDIAIDTQKQIRDNLIASQTQTLTDLQRVSDKSVEILEKQLSDERYLLTISAKDEIDLINKVQDERLKVIEAEMEAIRKRGDLTSEEKNRLKDLEKARGDLATATDERIKQSATRRIENQIELTQFLLELEQKKLDREALALDRNASIETRRSEKAQASLAKEAEVAYTIKEARALEAKAIAEINRATDEQIKQLEERAKLDKDNIAQQKEAIEAQIKAIELRAQGKDLTEAETKAIQLLREEVKTLAESGTNIDVKLSLDKDSLKADAEAAIEETGNATLAKVQEFFADPIQATLKDALIKGLKLNDAEAEAVIDSFSGLVDQVAGLVEQVFQVQAEAIGEKIEEKTQEIEDAKELADQTVQELEDNLTAINELQEKVATTRGANQQAVVAQLEAERSKREKLIAQEKKAADQTKKLEAEKIQLEADKLEKEKSAARVRIAIATAEAYIQAALAIAKAAQTQPFIPLGIIAIATATVATIAAIGSTIALAGTFARGGKIPKAQRGGLLRGASHADGGIPIAVNGRQVVEAEGGEFILTKGVSENPRLAGIASAVNMAAGGDRLAANGALVGTGGLDSITAASNPQAITEGFLQGLTESLAALPAPVVGVNQFEAERVKVVQQTARQTV